MNKEGRIWWEITRRPDTEWLFEDMDNEEHSSETDKDVDNYPGEIENNKHR